MNCVICNNEIKGEVITTSSKFQISLEYGNSADPVAIGKCCDKCNYSIVTPARILKSILNKHE
jgi:hypothetical protein